MILRAFRWRHPVILGAADGYGDPKQLRQGATIDKQESARVHGPDKRLHSAHPTPTRDPRSRPRGDLRRGDAYPESAVKRNADRFPEDFMFQLTPEEAESLRSQFVILKSGRGQHAKFLPRAFTEHGAIQAANVLNSPRAVAMGIHVVRAFVQLRSLLASNSELARKFAELERRVSTHDQAIVGVLQTIRELMNPPEPMRRPIGFVDLEEKK